jgi:hypothetical protein
VQIDQLLINSLKATFYMAVSGKQTSYPQKRQQRSGVTQEVIPPKNPVKNRNLGWLFFDLKAAGHGRRDLQ